MILVAIGANLSTADGAPPVETCRSAADALAALPSLRVVAVSRWWRSAPTPPSDQPDYVNGVARLEGAADPADLLAMLHEMEARQGRMRSFANAARTLDLDLVDLHGTIRRQPDPVLPHPRAHLRAFVLAPLLDVAPDWVHPALQRSGRSLLEALPPQDCTVLSDR